MEGSLLTANTTATAGASSGARQLSLDRGKSMKSPHTDDIDTGGSLSLYVPLFLAVESMAHALKQLGYTDEAMDATLCQLEMNYVYPANTKVAGTELSKTRLLLKQILIRQMIRSANVGASSLAFDKFDTDRSGLISFEKLRGGIDMDRETAYALAALMDPEDGLLGASGCVTQSDFTQALSPDYRLCISLDVLLEITTTAWLKEHRELEEKYRSVFAQRVGTDSQSHGLISFVEFHLLVQQLDASRTRASSVKIFREGVEQEQRGAEMAKAKEEGANGGSGEAATTATSAASKRKSAKQKKKKKQTPMLPRPPLTGLGANPPVGVTVAKDGEDEEDAVGSDGENPHPTPTSPAAGAAPDASAIAPSSPPGSPRGGLTCPRSLKPSLERSMSGSSDGKAPKPALARATSIKDNQFLTLDTVLALLRRHRIGLPARRPFKEFQAFLRRHKPASIHQQEATSTTMLTIETTTMQPMETVAEIEPILASEGITSIPE